MGKPIVDGSRIIARMGIIPNDPEQINQLLDPYTEYDGRITIEIQVCQFFAGGRLMRSLRIFLLIFTVVYYIKESCQTFDIMS